MKLLTNPIFDWATCSLESASVSDYAGPVWQCKKGGKQPAVPDPYKVAAAQADTNKDTATYNNAITHGNTYSPGGSQTYTSHTDPATGATVYDQNIALSPDQQKLYDQQSKQDLTLGDTAQGMLEQVQNSYAHPMDLSSAGSWQSDITGGQDLAAQRKSVEDALYRQQSSYLDPQYAQADTSMRTRLANQGITEGSEAWKNSIDEFNRGKSFDYARARDSSIAGGASEQALASQIAAQQGNFHNNARANYIQELYANRNQPLNEFNALRTSSPVNMPQFNGAINSTTNSPDLTSNIWNTFNTQNNIHSSGQEEGAGNTKAIGSVVGTAIMVF